MMESELDFPKATVLSKSMEPVIMYSDMPMMLKKGLHLNQIHNLDRSFEDNKDYLEQFLAKCTLSEAERESILSYAASQRQLMEEILKTERVEDEIPYIRPEEFERYPMTLSLSAMFCEKEILYSYEDYTEHLKQTKMFAETHPNYVLNQTSAHIFRNLQIYIHEGKWAMVSKNKAPVIHFVIHHPKLREAIENFVPPDGGKN